MMSMQSNAWPDDENGSEHLPNREDPATSIFPVRSKIRSEYEREDHVLLAMQLRDTADDEEPDDDKPDDDKPDETLFYSIRSFSMSKLEREHLVGIKDFLRKRLSMT